MYVKGLTRESAFTYNVLNRNCIFFSPRKPRGTDVFKETVMKRDLANQFPSTEERKVVKII